MSRNRCPICEDFADEWTDDCEHVSFDGDHTFVLVHAGCLKELKAAEKPKCICGHWGWPWYETTIGCPVHDPKGANSEERAR